MLDLFKPSSGTGTCPDVLLGIGYNDPDAPPPVQEDRSSSNYHLSIRFVNFFMCLNISTFLVKMYCLEPQSPF
jgi:hypothetical protein